MTSETKDYLAALFENKSDSDWILVWSKFGDDPKGAKISRWAQTIDEAMKAVKAACSTDGNHVYAGVLPRAKAHGKSKRGGVVDTSALLALWVDVDIAGPGHKTTGKLPANEREALALVEKIGVAPSMVVHSGGGIHAYWLLKEAWTFENESERNAAAALMLAWLRAFQIHAATMGLVVDPTFDLARVLRVPGSTNWKGETPTQCRIISQNPVRYDPSELRDLLPAEAFTSASPKSVASNQIGNLVLYATAEPPLDKLEALRQAEPKFDLSIKYQRKDFPKGDFTPSSYDMSLAATAAYAGWTEQEIADLLIYVRRTHNQALRIDDARYYVRTINIAINDAQRKIALDSLQGETVRVIGPTAEDDKRGYEKADKPETPGEKENLLQFISRAFGCRIQAVVKYKQDPPRYRLETSKGGIDLGTVDNLIGQGTMRSALAATDGHYIPKFKTEDWEAIAQALLDSCTVVTTGPESTDAGAMREWLNVYLDENPPGDLSESSIKNQAPHFDNDGGAYVCFYLAHFRNWVFTRQNEKVTAKTLGIMLRRANGRPSQVSHEERDEGGEVVKRTTRAVWRIPRNRTRRRKDANAMSTLRGEPRA